MRNEATTRRGTLPTPSLAPARPRFSASPRLWAWVIGVSTSVSAVGILIGTHKFQFGSAAIVLLPILWTVLIGGFIGIQKWKPVGGRARAASTHLMDVSIVFFLAGLGVQIGPSLAKFTTMGPAIVLQEVGHILGTVVLALPVAVALGMGRAAIGATWSIDRESYLAFALQRFGVRSGEYRGVFSVWVLGSVFGAAFISVLAGVLGGLGAFDPRALAMGLGLGSASMMLGGVGALSILYPDASGDIMALAALSNLVTNIVGFYAGVFIALPLCQKLYTMWSRLFGRDDEGRLVGSRSALKPSRSAVADVDVDGVQADPEVVRTPRTWIIAFAAAGVGGLLLNALGTGSLQLIDVAGILILLALSAAALVLAKLVRGIPSSIWVLAIATLASASFMPMGEAVATAAKNINVLYAGLPMIALIGMSLGRDIKALRSLSWKVVVIGLITLSASFIAAAAIAQGVLHL